MSATIDKGDFARSEIHDYLFERRSPRDSGMPNAEECKTAADVLSYVEEFFVSPLFGRLFRLLNEEAEQLGDADYRRDPPPVTYADIGVLVSCVADIRVTIAAIDRWLAAVDDSHDDLASAARAGRVEIDPTYDEHGRRRYG